MYSQPPGGRLQGKPRPAGIAARRGPGQTVVTAEREGAYAASLSSCPPSCSAYFFTMRKTKSRLIGLET